MKKLSIIVPVYGTEKYLDRCLKSLKEQIYQNIEVIIVNDFSPGNINAVTQKYIESDKRFRIINHEENKGLFWARQTGVSNSTGDYIGFVDSDDYVALDYFYSLMKIIEEKDADIAVGNTIIEKENGKRYVNHFHDIEFDFEELEKEQIRDRYFGLEGRCYSWHTIWNKIYSKCLWEKVEEYFKKLNRHIIMTEDVAYSSLLMYEANRIVCTKYSHYYYCQNKDASTNTDKKPLKKFCKDVDDMISTFDFVDGFLNSKNADKDIVSHFGEFRRYYARMWKRFAQYQYVGSQRKDALKKLGSFYAPILQEKEFEGYEAFFDVNQDEWNPNYHNVVGAICDKKKNYISFDIFDTLIKRPVYQPEHVFKLLQSNFYQITGISIDFTRLRQESEDEARREKNEITKSWQDISIKDIYDTLAKRIGIDESIKNKLMQAEIELEMELLSPRKSAKYLFDLAKYIGKHIVITSDMYLDRSTIETILKRCGYSGYEKIYLSSKEHLTKNTNDLFKYIIKDIKVNPTQILHIGDNWISDHINPESIGISTCFYPKACDAFENKIKGVSTNRCSNIANWAAGNIIEHNTYKKSVAYGAMMAIVANKYFDNPYVSYCEGSDFNKDPYLVGYYLMGMHLVGLVKWIIETSIAYGYSKIHFLARDGFLPYKVYELLSKGYTNAPPADYIYSSRKSVMPWILDTREALYQYPTEISNQSAATMKSKLEFCCRNVSDTQYETILKNYGVDANDRFKSKIEYNKFISIFLKEFYCKETHEYSKKIVSMYYKNRIGSNDATFDMGYSGRIQAAICKSLKKPIDALFVHKDSDQCAIYEREIGFKVHQFYEYSPIMSGMIREYLFSDIQPSCIGFYERDNEIKPKFEEDLSSVYDRWLIGKVQSGVYDFVHDYIKILAPLLVPEQIRSLEISLPFEGYIRNANRVDNCMYAASFFEDEVWGGKKNINIADFFNYQIELYNGKNGFSTGSIFCGKMRDEIIEKLKKLLRRNHFVYSLAKRIYRGISIIHR